ERVADDLPLPLGLLDAREAGEEAPRLGREDDLQAVTLAEVAYDLVGLALPEDAVVDEDAREARAQRLVEQQGHDRRVHPSRERADDAAVAHGRPHVPHRLLDERRDRPVAA